MDEHKTQVYLPDAAIVENVQLPWRRAGGQLELVPREAIHARGRRDYYSFGGAIVAVKEGVISTAPRVLTYLHGDHLESTSLTTNASGPEGERAALQALWGNPLE